MSEIEISASDRAKLLSFSEDELMANIALHDASAAAQFGIAGVANGGFATKAEMMGEMHAAGLWSDVVAKGKAIFRQLWNEAKNLVCGTYDQLAKSGDLEKVLTLLAGLLVTQLGWPNPLALLVVKAAMKHGLEQMCSVSAMPV